MKNQLEAIDDANENRIRCTFNVMACANQHFVIPTKESKADLIERLGNMHIEKKRRHLRYITFFFTLAAFTLTNTVHMAHMTIDVNAVV